MYIALPHSIMKNLELYTLPRDIMVVDKHTQAIES
jgi:hypothetical protein